MMRQKAPNEAMMPRSWSIGMPSDRSQAAVAES
jgi:hypothetical protein